MITLSRKILRINHRTTSMQMCKEEWNALNEICKKEKIKRNHLIEMIDSNHTTEIGLTYATRLFMLLYFKNNYASSSPENIKKILDHFSKI